MRRAILLLATMMLTVVVAAGVALAATINCGSASQDPLTPQCFGTDQSDAIQGRDARDIIYARGGPDEVNANDGNDEVYGAAGEDGLQGWDGNDKLYGGDHADILTDITPDIDIDELRGAAGNDSLDANDSDLSDTLVCGLGDNDTAAYDRNLIGQHDTVSASCEHLRPNGHIQ